MLANFPGRVREMADKADRGTTEDVANILSHLTSDVALSVSRFVDYASSLVEEGIPSLAYLHGTHSLGRG